MITLSNSSYPNRPSDLTKHARINIKIQIRQFIARYWVKNETSLLMWIVHKIGDVLPDLPQTHSPTYYEQIYQETYNKTLA